MSGYLGNIQNDLVELDEDGEVRTDGQEDGDQPERNSGNLTQSDVDERISTLMSKRFALAIQEIDHIRDSDWVKGSLAAGNITYSPEDQYNRFKTTADTAFEDTTPGGSFTVNPLPQYTRYADTRASGLLNRNENKVNNYNGNVGLGQYYSEAIHRNKRHVHFRMGVPEFNGLTKFFTGFYSVPLARLAKTGSIANDFGYFIGKTIGTVVTIVFWPFWAATTIMKAARFFMQTPASKYYYLRPLMSQYWQAVTTITNKLATYSKLLPFSESQTFPSDQPGNLSSSHAQLAKLLPGFFGTKVLKNPFGGGGDAGLTGFIDVYQIANRAQGLANRAKYMLDLKLEGMTAGEFESLGRTIGQEAKGWDFGKSRSLSEAVAEWFNSQFGKAEGSSWGDGVKTNMELAHIRTPKEGDNENGNEAAGMSLSEIWMSEFMDGTNFATFRVDNGGAVSESFSNTTTESAISSGFNSIAAQGRSAQFTFQGGKTGFAPVDAIVDSVKGLAAGVLDSVNLSGIFSLGGAAFVDIPEHWDNSSVQMPTMNYSFTLDCLYGNPMSRLMNLYIPISMLLAMSLPLATGPASYASPFLVQVFDPGRAQTRLGIVESLSLTRGGGNIGWNRHNQYLSVEVSLNIKDLSRVMAMPLVSSSPLDIFNLTKNLFDEDSIFTDYISLLAAGTLYQATSPIGKLRDQFTNKIRGIQDITSPAKWAGMIHDLPIIGMLDMLVGPTSRR